MASQSKGLVTFLYSCVGCCCCCCYHVLFSPFLLFVYNT